jgi:hypothetical protein
MTTLPGDVRPTRGVSLHLDADVRSAHVLVDADGNRVLELNDTALALWDLCDGTTTLDEMVAAILELFHADPGDVATDVTATIAMLHGAGAVTYYVP